MRRISAGMRWLPYALLGLLLSWLIGCTPSGDGATGGLEFWTMQLKPQFNDYFAEVIAEFEAENPDATVQWEDVPWEAMETKILTAVSAKTAPDVVNLNPKFASQLATRNAWVDLATTVPSEVQAEYLPKIWQAGTIDETSFGIPWYLTTQVTVYNQEILAAAGVETPPATYAELAEVARQVKDETGKYAFFTTLVPEDSGEVLESLVKMGVTLVDEQGKAAFETPEGLAAFEYWLDLYKAELLPPEILTQGHRRAIELYQAGELALVGTGAHFLTSIETNAPDVAKVSAIAPQITGETGKKNVAVMNLVIPQDTADPETALKFALFVTNTENQLKLSQQGNVLPSTQDAVDAYIAALEEKAELTPVEQAAKIGAEQLAEAEVLIPPMEKLNLLQKAIYENLQAAMLGQKTAEEALADAAKQFNQG
ncbi:MAG: sugar ABC transporter substrate-binding protein [Spirulina sp. SIO3F2]|nr:sugar ABC transporter substrate-binding protein [Spirulina sp. SIO3F2]